MNKIFQTICVLVLMTFSCFGGIIDYTTIGGGSSTFTGSYSNLNGLPYTITLTNSDGSIILTPITTNVVGNSSNVVVDISDGPNTNALTANQTQIIARSITNLVAGPGISVTGTNVVVLNTPNSWNTNSQAVLPVGSSGSIVFSVNPWLIGSGTSLMEGFANGGITIFGTLGTISINSSGDMVFVTQAGTTTFSSSGNNTFTSPLSITSSVNSKQNGANLTTNSIASASSTNLLATDSSGNEVAIPWAGLPSGGSSILATIVTNNSFTSINVTNSGSGVVSSLTANSLVTSSLTSSSGNVNGPNSCVFNMGNGGGGWFGFYNGASLLERFNDGYGGEVYTVGGFTGTGHISALLGYSTLMTNTMVLTASIGWTNVTSQNYLISITAGSAMVMKDQNNTTIFVPVINGCYPVKQSWGLAGIGITAIAVAQ